jgi:hypothetical protein
MQLFLLSVGGRLQPEVTFSPPPSFTCSKWGQQCLAKQRHVYSQRVALRRPMPIMHIRPYVTPCSHADCLTHIWHTDFNLTLYWWPNYYFSLVSLKCAIKFLAQCTLYAMIIRPIPNCNSNCHLCLSYNLESAWYKIVTQIASLFELQFGIGLNQNCNSNCHIFFILLDIQSAIRIRNSIS